MSSSIDKFCLKWNDFEQNIASSYSDLRKEADFSDVTLVCEGDQHIEAHRVILTACSPFFSTVLKRNKHSHPMIYMRGITTKDLSAIVDFIYHGEANIKQEGLEGFLALAEELQLKGLTSSEKHKTELDQVTSKEKDKKIPKTENKTITAPNYDKSVEYSNNLVVPVNNTKTLVALDENMTEQINFMMENVNDGEFKWKCTVCEKGTKGADARANIRRHVEIHIEGVSHSCNQCGKVSRLRNALNVHMSMFHRK